MHALIIRFPLIKIISFKVMRTPCRIRNIAWEKMKDPPSIYESKEIENFVNIYVRLYTVTQWCRFVTIKWERNFTYVKMFISTYVGKWILGIWLFLKTKSKIDHHVLVHLVAHVFETIEFESVYKVAKKPCRSFRGSCQHFRYILFSFLLPSSIWYIICCYPNK